ncbi:class I SAM-dependent methyltransferase [Limnobacter humi]|uniref:Class I SAM-dependent methyltransferase n=1 Tax=Limnobacter humi TaxID=1778671 RepID=A0ABT1WDZ5_9BURK|nr:class I SAM-dependent methyltransferase [Limnobacter humi]MCQ8895742.1 class I SAM-dependent methyltransferase [Limnobacter humi]
MNARLPDHTVIQAIRPKVLFKAIENRFPGQNVGFTVNIPSPDIGGMTLLESSVLVSLAKLTGASSLFEFGTFMGATTLLLAQNTPVDAQVVTIDLPPDEVSSTHTGDVLKDGDANDDYLRSAFADQGARCLARADAAVHSKVQQILQDSTTLDVREQGFEHQFDFIFIDGGHHFDIVKKDTENAYRMARKNAVVLWHDYASNIHSDVTEFLNGHAQGRRIYHVEHTMIAFELLGDFSTLLSGS